MDHDLVHLRADRPRPPSLARNDSATATRPSARSRPCSYCRPARSRPAGAWPVLAQTLPRPPAFPRKRPRADHRPGRRRRPAAPSAAPRRPAAAAGTCRTATRSSSNRHASLWRHRGIRVIRSAVTWRCAGRTAPAGPRHRPGHSASPASAAGAAIRVSAEPSRRTAAGRRTGPGSRAGPQRAVAPDTLPPGPGAPGTSTTATAPGAQLPCLAEPRGRRSGQQDQEPAVAAARRPAGSQICASSRSSGTRACSARDAATSAGARQPRTSSPGHPNRTYISH